MSVTEYAAKFLELAKFYPHFTAETDEFSKCIKFENGLRADIKRAIGYQKIRNFSELVSSCRIYEEDTKAHYKVVNERKGKGQQSRYVITLIPLFDYSDSFKKFICWENGVLHRGIRNEMHE